MSEIKVNKISPRAACGTVQLGDSGDTFTIPAGASITNSGTASGFGATGSASWNTTVKTSTFTAVTGEGYFVNTTGGAVTVNLPAGTAGAVVAVKDYAGTFDTNGCTIAPNGSDKIGGSTDDVVLTEEGIAITLVFIDSTQGWLVTDSGLQSEAIAPQFITATGGTITTVCTNYKVHTFTGPGTFTVCSVGNPSGSDTVDYLVLAGGGGGGHWYGAGAGAGGYRFSNGTASGSYTTAPGPLAPLGASALPVSAQGYPIAVGGGGAGGTYSPAARATNGVNSSFSTITSAGGGSGGGNAPGAGATYYPGGAGGSGGGAKSNPSFSGVAGAGNTPSTSPSQGNPAGNSNGSPENNAGGGGAGGASNPSPTDTPNTGGYGGAGIASSITGSPVGRGGGGAGNGDASTNGNDNPTGYPFGGGKSNSPTTPGASGAVNTGGGGGAGTICAPNSTNAGTGGSGIVIIRYKFQ